ncbi:MULTISPECIES: ABC transporter permease [Thermoactinomyces]|uniref:ABC-2 family transporter protein n=1 Tax=Thermoactinomyces daqus TaxID=1329516 RepID=A0A7W2AHN7_9BACL|nr:MULTISPECIES: ABC-2 family transporter protein [Thermoactinomyces]MBA4543402.1 ABC-2 family transporter protein [Thermoactinomyces daqus]MBH8599444.1 ABC-2 family transporter protein [Thermoactinomyces sp. CICC 10523]MBH8605233.1 ABC-2 family transporter protein [Thermoactinomyces sp. CICC 10522]MBH8608185.1 ABC-2 family transporter protein [Thermoactinomyces sp. CICC 10521]
MFHLHLFIEYFKQYIKTRMAYRWDFVTQFIMNFFYQGINLIFILVVFQHTSSLGGWNRYEVIFIYGYFLIPWAVFSAFFNLWDFNDRYVIKGELDRVLTRPVYSLVQVIMETMTPESLVGGLTGLVVMGYAAWKLDLSWDLIDILLLFLFTLGSVMIYGGIYIALTSISLYSDSKSDIQPIIYNIGNYGRYPVNIYHRVIQFALTWVLPFAFVGFYPASYLLDHDHWKWYAFLTPLVGILYLGFGLMCWNRGIRHYRGAGN